MRLEGVITFGLSPMPFVFLITYVTLKKRMLSEAITRFNK
jgi:hypothetical protein